MKTLDEIVDFGVDRAREVDAPRGRIGCRSGGLLRGVRGVLGGEIDAPGGRVGDRGGGKVLREGG